MSDRLAHPLNLGHRGARGLAPENTLASMKAGMNAGADGVEFDVQRTADGHLVVFHDDDLKRICGVGGRVVTSTLAQLRELDAGRHFGLQFAGELIPTLDEVIETLPASAFLNIEAKRFRFRSDRLEAGIMHAIQRHNLLARCIVSSFNPVLLWRMGRMDRTIPLGLLYAPDEPPGLNRGWPRHLLRLAALHPYHEQVTPKLMQQTHRRGQQVNTWTVNEPTEMRRLIDLGVDGIITDRPDLLSALLGGAD
ncbi:MAG TPA: glycerophosphodiester phosphodiesterase family protein [Anaerolineae bacterium]|nr:glycerophosphodiester phosphodiesterase family protein [Anaerolineae bacterium]